jgi:3-isopropylmalate dehydrogenase
MAKKYKVSVIPGDGIGPEIAFPVVKLLETLSDAVGGLGFDFAFYDAGDAVKEKTGVALPEETFRGVKESDVCLFIAVGETAGEVILPLRQRLDLYANIRPAKVYPNVPNSRAGVDLVIVRENTEDLYKRLETGSDEWGVALRVITRKASERIARAAFELARRENRKRVTCVHKSNVLSVTCGLFKKACQEVARGYPDIEFNDMYVDACALKLVTSPKVFDVIVTTNLFGDILSDLSAGLVGGLGMAPSGNIGDNFAIFEPVHGSAPDIAGKNIANPSATVLTTKMMLDWLGEHRAAETLEKALIEVLKEGKTLTPDLGGKAKTYEMAEAVSQKIKTIT